MKIVYLTYAQVMEFDDPEAWLRRLDFYTAQLEAMVAFGDVKSIHLINYEGTCIKNNVEYHFLLLKKWQLIFPFMLHRYVSELEPDVVIIHSLTHPLQTLCLSIQLGSRVKIFAIHHAEKPLRFPKNVVQKLADGFIQAYFFSSVDLAKPWTEKGQIRSQEKVHEVIEVSSFFYPTRGIDDHSTIKKNYLWVGRFDENKDPTTLVKAFSMFLNEEPTANLKIVHRGDGLRAWVDNFLSSSEWTTGRIVFAENIEHSELLNWYNDAAFIISTSHFESSGAAVCEGMACGCIPIVTNIPSFRMMTKGGTIGLLFEPADEIGLLDALRASSLLNLSAERRKVLGQFKENLSCESVSKKMFQVISEQ